MTGISNLQTLLGTNATDGTNGANRLSETPRATSTAVGSTSVAENVSSDQTVTLSGAGNVLAQAVSGDDVRSEKVSQLREAIAAGTYRVSSSDVADKLMQSMMGRN